MYREHDKNTENAINNQERLTIEMISIVTGSNFQTSNGVTEGGGGVVVGRYQLAAAPPVGSSPPPPGRAATLLVVFPRRVVTAVPDPRQMTIKDALVVVHVQLRRQQRRETRVAAR